MNKSESSIYKLIVQDRLIDAKEVFRQRMNAKMVDTISQMRQDIAKKFFNKK
jgi:hypothetical protein